MVISLLKTDTFEFCFLAGYRYFSRLAEPLVGVVQCARSSRCHELHHGNSLVAGNQSHKKKLCPETDFAMSRHTHYLLFFAQERKA